MAVSLSFIAVMKMTGRRVSIWRISRASSMPEISGSMMSSSSTSGLCSRSAAMPSSAVPAVWISTSESLNAFLTSSRTVRSSSITNKLAIDVSFRTAAS